MPSTSCGSSRAPRRRRRPASPRRTVWRTLPVSLRPAKGVLRGLAREPLRVDHPRARRGRSRRGSRARPASIGPPWPRRARRSRPAARTAAPARRRASSTPGSTSSVSVTASAVSSPSIPAAPPRTGAPWPRACAARGRWRWRRSCRRRARALIASTSASVRSGGCTLNTGSKRAQHASVSVKWCGAASAVDRQAARLRRAHELDGARGRQCRKCTRRAGELGAGSRSRATIAVSAAAGRPGMPRRLDHAPSCMCPPRGERGVLGVLRDDRARAATPRTRARAASRPRRRRSRRRR